MKKMFSMALLLGATNLFSVPMAQAQVTADPITTQGGEVICSYKSDGSWECKIVYRF